MCPFITPFLNTEPNGAPVVLRMVAGNIFVPANILISDLPISFVFQAISVPG